MTSQRQTLPGPAQLIHAAFVTYLLSNALPAVVIAGDLVFGFQATILSFFGSYIGLGTAERLESGQTPACLLGALANVLMVGGYVYYNLRRFSKRMRPFCLMASWLAGSAAVCALGAGVFLATGSETFIPSIGFFVWLASMIFMSFACWKLGKTVKCQPGTPPCGGPTTQVEGSSTAEKPDRSTDIPGKRSSTLLRWLIWTIPSLVLGLLGIDRGETLAIERLEMRPSEEWRREHSELAGELVLIDGELWEVNEQSKGVCTIGGWARHPDFLYD